MLNATPPSPILRVWFQALRKALVASLPPGPAGWSNGPVAPALLPRDFSAGRRARPRSGVFSFLPLLLPSALTSKRVAPPHHPRRHRLAKGEVEALSLWARAKREVKAMLKLRRQV